MNDVMKSTGAANAKGSKAASASRVKNPLRELIALGRMPVILELHLTESDQAAYLSSRQRHLARSFELPNLVILGEYLREADPANPAFTSEERSLVRKLQTYADLICSGSIDLAALDDGSRGRATLDNAIAAELLIGLGAEPSRLLINMVARNRQAEQVRQRLRHFAGLGVRNVLVLTGDLPVGASTAAKFPLDSIGMLELARDMLIDGTLPEDFWLAAAGHPNPDADPDGLRTLHKALAGAKVIITQAIYSVEQFKQWMQSLQQVGALDMVHVLAEIIPITSGSQLRAIADVPGMRVPVELIRELDEVKERIEREAVSSGHDAAWSSAQVKREGVRITRRLLHEIRRVPGVSGFYLGCIKSFEPHLELLKEAPLLPESSESLHKVMKLSGAERQRALAELPAIEAFVARERKRVHDDRSWLRRASKLLAAASWAEKVFQLIEWPKVPIFGCKKCDRCDLSPDALVCPRGCAKQMSHGPCGAPRFVNGRMLCEDTSRECTWAAIRGRRDQYGVPISDRIASKAAPSAGFYEGKTYSSFLPVLNGEKSGPNWNLAWRAPISEVSRALRLNHSFAASGSPRELITLAEAQRERLTRIIRERPHAETEELLLTLLLLIGTPTAIHLVESKLAELGLPAEGAIADLSMRERMQLAQGIPVARKKIANAAAGAERNPLAHCDELLRVIPDNRQLRQSVRRELANGLIQHIAAMGVEVHYTTPMLDGKNIDNFLNALTILKDELQMARPQWPTEYEHLSARFQHIHYKLHYHAPVSVNYLTSADGKTHGAEIQVNLRAFSGVARFRLLLRDAIEKLSRGLPESQGELVLEGYTRLSTSQCWKFNTEFWKRLREFEQATGVNYDASIGGSTDHNLAYARSVARAYYDRIHVNGLEHEKVYALEIGVAATHRARAFLGEYRRLCELHGNEDYKNTHYLLADFSEAILERSAAELGKEHPWLETVLIDAGDPVSALNKYKGRVVHAHLCNVYDNLPADQVVWLDDHWHVVEGRLYIQRHELEAIVKKHGLPEADVGDIERRLFGLSDRGDTGVAELLDWLRERFTQIGKSSTSYVPCWMELVAAMLFDERYVQASTLSDLFPSTSVPVDGFDSWLKAHLPPSGQFRMHINGAAIAGFTQLASILHQHGVLEIIDLFVQRWDEYRQTFKGPAKYDGSTVNWLNGPLFRYIGERAGYQVRFQPFRPFDPKSPSVVLLAQPKALVRPE